MDRQRGGRLIFLQGMGLILIGLVWGFVVPHTTFPRLALTAHIQFMVNGLLLMIMGGVVVKFITRIGAGAMAIAVAAAWLTWPMLAAECANSWWGTTGILPIAAEQAGATGGQAWQEAIMKATHILAGLALVVAWALLTLAFAKQPASQD
jgi:(hydroxyamino)benzene mutase